MKSSRFTIYHPQNTLIYTTQLTCQNELKLAYSNVGIKKKIPGGETPGPPLQRAAASNAAGRGASNAGGWREGRGGEGRGRGEGRGKGREGRKGEREKFRPPPTGFLTNPTLSLFQYYALSVNAAPVKKNKIGIDIL